MENNEEYKYQGFSVVVKNAGPHYKPYPKARFWHRIYCLFGRHRLPFSLEDSACIRCGMKFKGFKTMAEEHKAKIKKALTTNLFSE